MGFWDFKRKDSRGSVASADGDAGPGQMSANGDIRVIDDDLNTLIAALIADLGGGITYLRAAVNLAKNGTRVIVAAPGANKQIWVYGIWGTTDADGNVTFLDSTPTDLSGVSPIGANGGFVLAPPPNGEPWFKCATDKAFQATLTTNSDFDGSILYSVEDV